MPFGLTIVTAPDSYPVTLPRAKEHLRVTWAEDDNYIGDMLAGAVRSAQRECGLQFVTATLALWLDDFPRDYDDDGPNIIRLPVGPVVAVDEVGYYDTAGAWQTVAAADYSVGLTTGRIMPVIGWPSVDATQLEAVKVTYRAGFGGPADVPADAVAAVLLILADRYTNRGDNVTNFLADREIPAAARRLLRNLSDGQQW